MLQFILSLTSSEGFVTTRYNQQQSLPFPSIQVYYVLVRFHKYKEGHASIFGKIDNLAVTHPNGIRS